MTGPRGVSMAWILLGIVIGGLLGLYVPLAEDALAIPQWILLAVMVFSVVSSLPLLSLGRALTKPRVLAALFALNLLVVPLVAFVLSRVVWQSPEIQVALLLVLMAPGVALSLQTAVQAGGNIDSVLAATPVLLVGQLVVVPLYAVLLSGGVLSFFDLPPTLWVIGLIIVAPSLLALTVQALLGKSPRSVGFRKKINNATPLLIAVTIAVVLWNKIPAQTERLEELYRVVPLFLSFLVLLAPLGLLAGILASLTTAEKRAVMIVGAGRGGIIMLPISLALDPAVWGLVPLVVIVQLGIEVLGLLVYRSIVPEIVPSTPR